MNEIKCPKCGKEIDTLNNVQSGTASWTMCLDSNGDTDYEQDRHEFFISDDQQNDWNCPNCGHIIATDEEDAIKFLKTGETE
jgi:predicted RNA-binding Zn-ribbon protein involved in translation (DUF1610 family)